MGDAPAATAALDTNLNPRGAIHSTTQVTRFIEQPSPPGEEVACVTCRRSLQRSFFSAKQWNSRKRDRGIRCRDCSSRMHRDLDAAEAMSKAAASNRVASGVHIKPQNHGYCDYMDQLFRHDCFGTLVQLKLFPSAKDCSESMGALQGVGSFDEEPLDPAVPESSVGIRGSSTPGVLVLAIGDGTTPRTAALACYLTKWHAVSIDPLLENRWVGSSPQGVRRLTGVRGTLDDYISRLPHLTSHLTSRLASDPSASVSDTNVSDTSGAPSGGRADDDEPLVQLVLLCVHSHARFIGTSQISAIRAKYGHVATTLVAIPCCASFHPDKDVGRRPGTDYVSCTYRLMHPPTHLVMHPLTHLLTLSPPHAPTHSPPHALAHTPHPARTQTSSHLAHTPHPARTQTSSHLALLSWPTHL